MSATYSATWPILPSWKGGVLIGVLPPVARL
jgi:hypothetical protein